MGKRAKRTRKKKSISATEDFCTSAQISMAITITSGAESSLAGAQFIDPENPSSLSAHTDQRRAEGHMESLRNVTLVLGPLTNRIELD